MAPLDNKTEVRPVRKPGEKKSKVTLILVVLLLLSIGSTAYLYNQVKNLKANPEAKAQEEVAALVAKVGQLIVLPEGETPTVATVNDPEKLKEQPFFAKAKAGDKVLIYTNAKKAILYNPTSHKIVEVAPLNIGAPTTATESTPTETTTDNNTNQ